MQTSDRPTAANGGPPAPGRNGHRGETPTYHFTVPPMSERHRSRRPRTVPVENVRAGIAYILLAIFAGTIVLTFVASALGWASASDIRQFEAPIVSAEVSLLGAATGFYYASRSESRSHLPPTTSDDDEDDD